MSDELTPELTDAELDAATAPEGDEAVVLTDVESSRAFEAELAEVAVDTYVEPIEYAGIDTRTAEANYATRSNIVVPD